MSDKPLVYVLLVNTFTWGGADYHVIIVLYKFLNFGDVSSSDVLSVDVLFVDVTSIDVKSCFVISGYYIC